METKSNDHLNCYLTQLSQPPDASIHSPVRDDLNKLSDDEHKTIQINLEKLAMEEKELTRNNHELCEKDTEPESHIKDYKEEKSVPNQDAPTNGTNIEQNSKDVNSKKETNSLSNQIRKLSDVVQNEAEVIQRQIHTLEERRLHAYEDTKLKNLHIEIPKSPIINSAENSANSLNIPNFKTPIASPNISSLGNQLNFQPYSTGRFLL